MTKFGYILLAIVALVGGFAGYTIHGNLGGTSLTYTAALSQIERYNFDKSIITDLTSLRGPLSGLISVSALWSPGAIASTTQNLLGVATTTVTATSTLGDQVLVSFDSSTSSQQWEVGGKVSAANTVLITLKNLGASSLTLTTSTIRVQVLPTASFVAPAALTAATTSSP